MDTTPHDDGEQNARTEAARERARETTRAADRAAEALAGAQPRMDSPPEDRHAHASAELLLRHIRPENTGASFAQRHAEDIATLSDIATDEAPHPLPPALRWAVTAATLAAGARSFDAEALAALDELPEPLRMMRATQIAGALEASRRSERHAKREKIDADRRRQSASLN